MARPVHHERLVEDYEDRDFPQPLVMKRCGVDAVTWSEHNTEAFAGLHNKGKRIVIIMDEASNIADKV